MNDYRTENPLATIAFFAFLVLILLVSFFINPYLFSAKPLVQKIEVSKEVANSYLQTYTVHDFEDEGPTEFFSQVLQGSTLPASSSALDQFPQ